MTLRRALLAELLGTTLLLATVVGSGIMGAALSPGNAAVALLANAGATAAALYVLITVLAPVSGAHFNPAVTLAALVRRELPASRASAYIAVQLAAAMLGVALAHAMFDQPLLQAGTHVRTGWGQWLSEALATFGLVLTILVAAKRAPDRVATLVAAWIFAAYWFTASTSFANPAVTVARAFTDTFAGLRAQDAWPFIGAQLVGLLAALTTAPALLRASREAPGGSAA